MACCKEIWLGFLRGLSRQRGSKYFWGDVLQPKIDPLLMLVLVVALGMAVTLLLPLSASESVADNLPPLQAGVLIE